MSLIIRAETPTDYATIAEIHTLAFDQRVDEALIVALSRQQPTYTPTLSLVAEREGRVVGHVLFTPCRVQLLAQTIAAVLLAPIGVHPAYQSQGIGGELIAEGHRIAREKNYQLSMLVGHPSYYPRFGYHTGMFGAASLTIDVGTLTAVPLVARPPQTTDIPALMHLWQQAEQNVDFAIQPEATLLAWISPHPQMQTLVYERDKRIIGCVTYHRQQPAELRRFFVSDSTSARQVAAHYAQSHGLTSLTLPLHPHSAGANAFESAATVSAWEAGMAHDLADDGLLAEYLAQVQSGARPAGRPQWSTAFDLA